MTGTRLYNPPRNGEGNHAERGGGGPRILEAPIKQVKRARQLRRQMRLPEVLLWQQLRKRPGGLKFRRQFPTDRITTDFACLSHRLIVEVDGEGHSFGEQPRRDASRDAGLRRDGFDVMRIAAVEVLQDLDGVLTYVLARCSEVGPLRHSAPLSGSPPRTGEDL